METACIIDMTVRVAGIEEGSSPRSKKKYINTGRVSIVRTNAHTEAERPQRNTYPGTGNRPPGREPFGKTIYNIIGTIGYMEESLHG